jgi:hypothetical protein
MHYFLRGALLYAFLPFDPVLEPACQNPVIQADPEAVKSGMDLTGLTS